MENFTEEWKAGYASAERSDGANYSTYKKINALNMCNLPDRVSINGREIELLIQLVEARGIKIPDRKPDTLSGAEVRSLRKQYLDKCSDLKPAVTTSYKLSPEDSALYDEFLRIRNDSYKYRR